MEVVASNFCSVPIPIYVLYCSMPMPKLLRPASAYCLCQFHDLCQCSLRMPIAANYCSVPIPKLLQSANAYVLRGLCQFSSITFASSTTCASSATFASSVLQFMFSSSCSPVHVLLFMATDAAVWVSKKRVLPFHRSR